VVKNWLKGRDGREEYKPSLGWLHGGPGLGKSLLVAKLVTDVANAPVNRQGLYYHRFRSGDARNSRRFFLLGLQSALVAWPPLSALEAPTPDADDGKVLEEDIKTRLSAVNELPPYNEKAPPPRFVVLIDGLDECTGRDSTLPGLLTGLLNPGTVWLTASRPNPEIISAFETQQCEAIFTNGLPPMSSNDIRAMLIEGLGQTSHTLVARDEDQVDGGVTNPFICTVVEKAEGMPLYVYLVVEDLKRGAITVKDEDKLPIGLMDYYNQLLARLGVSDVQRDLTLITALLASAEEPLTAEDLVVLVPGVIHKAAQFTPRMAKAIGAGRALLRPALTPQGESGYILYHHSFKEHVLTTDNLAGSVTEARENLYQLAGQWQNLPIGNLRRHLFRWGTQYNLRWNEVDGMTQAYQHLTSFTYLQARCRDLSDAVDVTDLVQDYELLQNHLNEGEEQQAFQVWVSFFQEKAHILRRGNEHWPSYKILLQLAVEHADDSPVTQSAEAWLEQGHCDWKWLRNPRRIKQAAPSNCLGVLEGHTSAVKGAKVLDDGRILSWSYDHTLRLWNSRGEPHATLEGHSYTVTGCIVLEDGRLLSWSEDYTLRLWSNEGKSLATLEGHSDYINGVIVLDGGCFISWSDDGTLRLWSSEGMPLTVLKGHSKCVNGVTILDDGRFLSWSKDHTLRLWSNEGKPLATLEGHSDYINGVIVLNDERFLSCSDDGTLRIWGREGMPLTVLKGHSKCVNGVTILDDGRFLSWSKDHTLRLWSNEGKPLATLEGDSDSIEGVMVLDDGRFLSFSYSGIRLWSNQGESLATLKDSLITGVNILDDGCFISWSSYYLTLRLWSFDGMPLTTLEGHSDYISGVIVLNDERFLSWSDDGTLRLWTSKSKIQSTLEGHSDLINGVEVLDNGNILSYSSDETRLSNNDGKFLANLEGDYGGILGVKVLEDGCFLSWFHGDNSLWLWNHRGKLLVTLEGHSDFILGATILDDGRFLSWSYDMTLKIWSPEGVLLVTLEGHLDRIMGVKILDNGRFLSWSWDKTLRLWSREGKSLATLEGHSDIIEGVNVLEDGRFLSWSGSDYTPRLWSSEGKLLAMLEGHLGFISAVKVLEDGRFLSWSNDNTIRLWNGEGESVATLEGHSKPANGVTILDDGRFLSWSRDGTIRLWTNEGETLKIIDEPSGWDVEGVKVLDEKHILTWCFDGYKIFNIEGYFIENYTFEDLIYKKPKWLSFIIRPDTSSTGGQIWRLDKHCGISFLMNETLEPIQWYGEHPIKVHTLSDDGMMGISTFKYVFVLQFYKGNKRIQLSDLKKIMNVPVE